MKAFMDKDFLLETETAKKLFHDYAEKTPILDYHCHINPKEIAEDRQFDNITQVWLGGDHYKWRFMRSCGVDEKYITGDASDYEKFCKWAECLGKAIGNPLFHWSHLELQRYFGYNGVLNKNTADEVWNLCNEKLQQPSMSVRNLIKQSNVTLICTTDDPIDSLEWHKKLAADDTFDVKVLPAWRPDKAMNIEKPDYLDYLEESTNTVRSRREQSLLILLCVYLGIWAVSVLFFWLLTGPDDAMGYGIVFLWLVLPVAAFVISLLIGRGGYGGRQGWLLPLVFGAMHMLAGYATFMLANMLSVGILRLPQPSLLLKGTIISAAGFWFGALTRRRRRQRGESGE